MHAAHLTLQRCRPAAVGARPPPAAPPPLLAPAGGGRRACRASPAWRTGRPHGSPAWRQLRRSSSGGRAPADPAAAAGASSGPHATEAPAPAAAEAAAEPARAAASLRLPLPAAPPGCPRGTAVVVGAGPAGAAAAMHLAAIGFRVVVLERRPRPAPGTADRARTFMLALGERGLCAVEPLGVRLPPGLAQPISGSVFALRRGAGAGGSAAAAAPRFAPDPFSPGARVLGVDRQGLAAFLVGEAERLFPGAITFAWEAPPEAIDLERRRVALVGGGGGGGAERPQQQQLLPYDLLVGADGANSTVRAALLERGRVSITPLSSPVAELEYKAFHDLPHIGDLPEMLRGPTAAAGGGGLPGGEGTTFYAFSYPRPDRPTPGSLTLYVNSSGKWSGTLFQPKGEFSRMSGAADHEAAVRDLVPEGALPDPWLRAMGEQMAAWGAPGRIHPMAMVSRMADPELRVALLGDAAHSVTPQMGQGCNSSLEDAMLLGRALAAAPDVAAALSAFSAARTPQVHALQRMEAENAWVRRPVRLGSDPPGTLLARVAWVSFFCLLPLLRLLPGAREHVHASLFQNIIGTQASYRRLHALIRAAPLALAALLGSAAWAAAAIVRGALRLAGWA